MIAWFILLLLLAMGVVWFALGASSDHFVAQGRYDVALRIVALTTLRGTGRSYLLGDVLTAAGRYEEAERMLRDAIDHAGGSKVDTVLALEDLGNVVMDTGHFEEAQRCFRDAADILPNRSPSATGMAEVLLRRGGDAARALEYIEDLAGPSGLSRNKWTINGITSDDYWALKAWALAELGRSSEVARAVAAAIRHTNPKSCPEVAATYRRLGMAMQAMGRGAEAKEYFERARNADPSGRWGVLASYSGLSRTPVGLPRGTSTSSKIPPASLSASNISSSSISTR